MADQTIPYHHPLPSAPNDQQQSYSEQFQGQPQQLFQQQPQSPPQYYQQDGSAIQQQQARPQAPQQQAREPQEQSRSQPPRPQPTPQKHSRTKSRTFSFQSEKSHKSHKSGGSKDLYETHEEKEARRLHTKADPSLAIREAEPSVVAMTQSSLAPLRSITHKDALGNPIADPDKSNPTRSRWERPLDTIRSFEAAIDGGYSRKSLHRSESESVVGWNRRSSYNPTPQPRFQRDSYYSQRPASYRQEAGGYDGAAPSTGRTGYFDQPTGYGGPYNQGGYSQGPYNQGPPRRLSRMQTDPQYQNYGREQNIYPMPHKDRSYETVTSAAASGNSDHAGYQTDPTSSDNSSIERQSPTKRPQQPQNDYGIGFNQAKSTQPQSFTVGVPNGGRNEGHSFHATPGTQQQQQPAPTVPRKDVASVLKRQATNEQNTEKRKSWFARRFSKNN
ncbi:hypothetical protein NLU13_9160 [Sarocladium strictum]|uniref:Uncharacterized protein n=1 Tax=Sarocladium strictum TaxID=5046 RepID=A0AA39GBU0_SARSR|nr:hypothetical protein NLU13_9160 [Sarocladium strictum]